MTTHPRSPLAVVQLYKGYPPVRGGIEGHVALLSRLLTRRGVAVEVLCAADGRSPRRDEDDGVRVHRCASPLTLASTPLPPTLPWALHRSNADIVHLHYPWPPNEVAWLLGGRARPLVITVHCEAVRHPWLARLLWPLTQRVFAQARSIFITGPFMHRSPVLARHGERIRLLPLGVDLDRFRPDRAAPDPLPAVPHPRVLFVGQLRHYKGLPLLAAALARLPNAQLIVVGDGPERPAFEQALAAHGVRNRTHLCGDVDDDRLLRLVQTADAAVLASTSRAEAFGLAIAEAQACGVPAVTTEVGTGTAQTVADGVSGRVVPPNDPALLAEALAWCLDPERAPALRQAARVHAESHLCGARMVATVREVYEDARGAS